MLRFIDWLWWMNQFREPRKVAPPIMGNHDESEEMSLIVKPLMDYVSTINSLQGRKTSTSPGTVMWRR